MHVLLRQGGKWLTPERAGGMQLLMLPVSTSTLYDSWITIISLMFYQVARCSVPSFRSISAFSFFILLFLCS